MGKKEYISPLITVAVLVPEEKVEEPTLPYFNYETLVHSNTNNIVYRDLFRVSKHPNTRKKKPRQRGIKHGNRKKK